MYNLNCPVANNRKNSFLSSWNYSDNWYTFFRSFVKFPFHPITI